MGMSARCLAGITTGLSNVSFTVMEQCIVSSTDVTSLQERVFVGLDYAMSGVQVCVLDADGRVLSNRKLPNDSVALTRHVSAFGARIEAAIEASTGSADLADELQSRGWRT